MTWLAGLDTDKIGNLNSMSASDLEETAAALDNQVYEALARIDHLERQLDERLKTAPPGPVRQVLSMSQNLGVEACVRQYENVSAMLDYFCKCEIIAKWLDEGQSAEDLMKQAGETPNVLPLLVDGLEGNGGQLLETVLAKRVKDRKKLNEELVAVALGRLRDEMDGLKTSADTKTWLVRCVGWVREQGPWQKLQGALKEYAMEVSRVIAMPVSACDKIVVGWTEANKQFVQYRESLRTYEGNKWWRQFVFMLRQCFLETLNQCFCENVEKMEPTMQMMTLLARALNKENAMKAMEILKSKPLVLDEETLSIEVNLLGPAKEFESRKLTDCAVSFIGVLRDRLMTITQNASRQNDGGMPKLGKRLSKVCKLLAKIHKCKMPRPAPWFFKERIDCIDSVVKEGARVFFTSQKDINSIFGHLLDMLELINQERRDDGVWDIQIGIVLRVIGLWSERLPDATVQPAVVKSDAERLRTAITPGNRVPSSLPWIGQGCPIDIESAFRWPSLILDKLSNDCEWKVIVDQKELWNVQLLELMTGGRIEATLPKLDKQHRRFTQSRK